MALIEWSDELSVGIETADAHHRKLVSMINALQEAMESGHTGEVVERILEGLIVYTQKHFRYEEQLFLQHGYPDYEEHKAQHDAMVDSVLDLHGRLKRGSASAAIELMRFLRTWLTEHVMGFDKRYSEFLIERGVK